MTRAVEEWIGKTDDSAIPPRVRLRVFLAHDGVCHISKRKIQPGEAWDLDHIKALCNGGEHREKNLAPALRQAHRRKTADDVAERARVDRIRAKHTGAIKPKGWGPNRKFNRTVGPTKRALREQQGTGK